jgi:hypothetical protein
MPIAPPLIGTYTPPAVRIGDRVTCLFRDAECVVTSVSDAPIPWPRVQPEGRGGCGLWVCDELVRAIRTESAIALKHWFGAATTVVWRWRKAFGVGGRTTTTVGSKRAIRAAAKKGADANKVRVWTAEELDAKSANSKRLGLRPPPRWTPERGGWTEEQLALLGTDQDEVIAKKIGRTPGAVRRMRGIRKIPAFNGLPGGGR